MHPNTDWNPLKEHSTYEEGIHLSTKEKLILASIVGGVGILVILMLIGIGF